MYTTSKKRMTPDILSAPNAIISEKQSHYVLFLAMSVSFAVLQMKDSTRNTSAVIPIIVIIP